MLLTLVQHRLFQFAVLGGLIFAVAPRARSPESIEVTSERLAALRAAEVARSRGKTPPEELGREVDQRAIEDEILYREGVRLGLDRNDGIVRQRVVQKVLFLAEEVAGASRPANEADLAAFFTQNRERWSIGARTRFSHVYRHGREALDAWLSGPATGDPPPGEPSPVAAEVDADAARLTTSFGAGFVEAIAGAPVGLWAGPYPSAFGWHLVRVAERRPARPAELGEVRAAVVEAFDVHRRQEAVASFLTGAFARYRVTVDGARLPRFTPSRRVAFRSVPSGED
jgi:PPIC-type PPIASE domain